MSAWSPPAPPRGRPPMYAYHQPESQTVPMHHPAAARSAYERPTPGLLSSDGSDLGVGAQYLANSVRIYMEEENMKRSLHESYVPPQRIEEQKAAGGPFALNSIHLKTLQTIFTLLDSDQDKLLDIEQLRTAIIAMGIPPSERLVQEIQAHVPTWAGKGVDFTTFKNVISDRLKSNPVHMSDIDELFRVFEDADTEGLISDHHLRHVMGVETTNNTNLSEEEVDEIFKELRIGKRQQIDYKQFLMDISSGFVNFETAQ